ncbi:MAG: T9SS type A sorting domain-containing protein [Bacteroidales bacterium]|nr:T9SS type A sorting domain-containing protein [Bacteroidales bacterium]
MKKLILLCVSVLAIIPVPELYAQKLIRNKLVTGICLAGDKVNKIYIPPSKEFFKKSGQKGGATVTIYHSGFPTAAVTALEYAGSIIEAMLPPEVSFTVIATYTNITSSGVLANSSATGYALGWGIDAFRPFAIYPASLAEKIAGEKLNLDLEGDIELIINSSINWYFGTDGNTPILQYDLVTVAIHELIHGMGFFDSFDADATTGSYGAGAVPLIYDTFVENLQGKILTDTLVFPNPSLSLRNELTSGNIYFSGPLTNYFTTGTRPKLFSPLTFVPGSSVSHLDEQTTLEINSLMTPYIDRGEAIHDPGKLTASVLGDLGWINTRLIHEAPKDTEEHISEVNISVTVKSDTTYNHNKVGLVWSFDSFTSSDTLFMTSPQSDNTYYTTVSIPQFETELEYYLYAEDSFSRTFRSPSFIDRFRHRIYIGTDTVKPLVAHIPADYYFSMVDSIIFEASATDNIGVDTVYVEYRINNRPVSYLGLKPVGKDLYKNGIRAKNLLLEGGDSLHYRIIVVDQAAAANQTILPKNDYFAVGIEEIGAVVESYTTDFSDAAGDFFNVRFKIAKPDGFSAYGLHTEHPYESPEETGDSIGYVAMLRHPVKFDATGMIISFREIVLVEPGEEGSVFGNPEFYDYVIVEGSKNFGKSWFRLVDGYDSRFIKAWETAYNSSINGNNSTYVGNESMLVKHTIFPRASSDISAGDSMIVRFRLFSDPYANGWGWVIMDLKIGPLIDQVEDIRQGSFVLYPNPGNGAFKIKDTRGNLTSPFRFSIFNSSGTCILTDRSSEGPELNIDISGYPPGMYFIVLYRDDGVRTFKYNLVR